ncbi:complex I NDUFA9 subunit family protein [Marinobacter salicampi]|uniref:complex I NDUFA9 subunit family protein n=1 Tax=Marinobacter salicampi TaxID=435907 RepID=UPI00140AB356|nr:complex I NDUFA9 subunit family protein [Marinobacter salicampi]
MPARRVTVLGGSGFLGKAVSRELAEQGFEVRIACRNPARVSVGLSSRVELVTCDIRNEDDVTRALTGADAAVNAVSLYVEKESLTFEEIHVVGAGRIARCARECGVGRLVQLSGIGASEASPSSYVRARARGERVVAERFPDAIILRPSVLCDRDAGFVDALRLVSRLPVVPLFGKGQTRLQPVYVADVAAGVRGAISLADTAGKCFELGGATVYTYREAVELVLRHEHRSRPFLPLPFPVWHGIAAVLGLLPNPPLNRDQVFLMEEDNVVNPEFPGFADLGVEPVDLETLLRA